MCRGLLSRWSDVHLTNAFNTEAKLSADSLSTVYPPKGVTTHCTPLPIVEDLNPSLCVVHSTNTKQTNRPVFKCCRMKSFRGSPFKSILLTAAVAFNSSKHVRSSWTRGCLQSKVSDTLGQRLSYVSSHSITVLSYDSTWGDWTGQQTVQQICEQEYIIIPWCIDQY